MIPLALKALTAIGIGVMLFRRSSTAPKDGGGFIETRSGVVYVRTGALAWTMQALAQKGIAPTPAGDGYKAGTAYGTLRDDGGLNAAAWANQMQSNGLDVAITASPDASSSATGMLACFPSSERKLWCAPGKGFAILLQARRTTQAQAA